MTQIAMKFVQWDVPELEKLKDSKGYKLSLIHIFGGALNEAPTSADIGPSIPNPPVLHWK